MAKRARFLAFSDFHAHNFVEGSTRESHYEGLPGLFNSRLIGACKTLNAIREEALFAGINLVLFGGDLFHSRSKIDVDVLNLIHHEFKKFNDSKIHVVMIPGNHDYADKNGEIHSLSYLADLEYIHIVDEVKCVMFEGIDIFCLPYSESKEELLKGLKELEEVVNFREDTYKVLLGHCGIQGATVGSDYVMLEKHDLSIKDVPTHLFDLCLFGHYHERQKLNENSWYIGATFPHNWGDANTNRGYLRVEYAEENPHPFLRVIYRPLQLHFSNTEEFNIQYLSVDFDKPMSPISWGAKYLAKVKGTPEQCSKFIKDHDHLNLFVSVEEIHVLPESKAELEELPDSTINPTNMVDFWVDLHSGVDTDALKKLGQTILAKALEDSL